MTLPRRTSNIAALVLATVGLSFVWLVLLPIYARQPEMRRHLQWLDEKGIDPSAMYYTELPMMEQLLRR